MKVYGDVHVLRTRYIEVWLVGMNRAWAINIFEVVISVLFVNLYSSYDGSYVQPVGFWTVPSYVVLLCIFYLPI